MWNIGNVEIKNRYIAAPLAGISNPVYRLLNHEHGAGLVVSEMISDKALHYKSKKTQDMCTIFEDEHPVALQLFGSDPTTMHEAAQFITKNTSCDIIDINMGCPVTKVLKAHSGSWLLQEPELAYEIIKAVKEGTDRPVTVKMRAGWDQEHITCVEIAQLAEKAGASAITIHGRTKSQMFSGDVNYSYIKMVKDAVNIPVIGNGDIESYEDAQKMFEETGCDAVMIGRGLLGHPYLLDSMIAKEKGEDWFMPSYDERIQMILEYYERLSEYVGEKRAIRMMRGASIWYIIGMPHANPVKAKLSQMTSEEELRSILDDYRKELSEID